MYALKNRFKPIILLLVMALLVLSACGGDEETPTVAPTNTPAPAATATTAPTTAPATATVAVTSTEMVTSTETVTSTGEVTNTATITASDALTTGRSAPVSPLAQPNSPLNQPASPLGAPENDGPMPTPPPSKSGTSTVTGRLISNLTNQPLNHAIVRLAEITCPSDVKEGVERSKCVWALDNAFSPSTFTDANGYFAFSDVEPRDYVVIIGDMIGRNTRIFDDEQQPMIWNATADEVIDIGEHTVDY